MTQSKQNWMLFLGDKGISYMPFILTAIRFGHDSCNRMELLSVHKNEDMARRNAETIGNNHIIQMMMVVF